MAQCERCRNQAPGIKLQAVESDFNPLTGELTKLGDFTFARVLVHDRCPLREFLVNTGQNSAGNTRVSINTTAKGIPARSFVEQAGAFDGRIEDIYSAPRDRNPFDECDLVELGKVDTTPQQFPWMSVD